MNLKNSYIFLNDPDKKDFIVKNSNGREEIYIDTDSVRLIIENLFNITSNNKYSWYNHYYNFSIEDCNIEIEIREVKRRTYVNVISTAKTRTQIIKSLEQIHSKIDKSDIQKKYIMVISRDAISEHYCNKIYPKLNEFERNLKHLLFNIFVLEFGIEYPNSTTSEKFQKKLGRKFKDGIEMVQKFFYVFDYGMIQSFLFDDSTEKNNWDRLFKSKIPDDDIKERMDGVRKHRNTVMHCGFFYKDEYNQCKKLVAELNRKVLKAIDITTDEDFAEKNHEELAACISSITEKFKNLRQVMKKAEKNMAQIREKFAPLFENITWKTNNMFNGIAEMVNTISNINYFSMPKLFLPITDNKTNDDTKL